MMNIEKISNDSVSGRDLYFVSLLCPEDISNEITLSSANFVCLIAWDSENASKEDISNLVVPLIKSGCSYFCTWGAGCERLHDIIDDIILDLNVVPEISVIMTTWHYDDSLEDALFFFLNVTWVDEYYEDTTNSSLAISINSNEQAIIIKNAVKDPRGFANSLEG